MLAVGNYPIFSWFCLSLYVKQIYLPPSYLICYSCWYTTTHLLPTLKFLFTRYLHVFSRISEQNDVYIISEQWQGGQDEHHCGQDHHAQGGEGIDLQTEE